MRGDIRAVRRRRARSAGAPRPVRGPELPRSAETATGGGLAGEAPARRTIPRRAGVARPSARPAPIPDRPAAGRRTGLGREQPRGASEPRSGAVRRAAEPPIRIAEPVSFGRDRARSRIRPRSSACSRLKATVVAAVVLAAVVTIGLRAQGSVAETKGDLAARVAVARQAFGAAQERLQATDLTGAERQFEIAEQSLSQANQLLVDRGVVGGVAAGQGSGDIRTGQQLLAAGQDTARDGRKLLAEVRTIGAQTAGADQGFYRAGEVLNRRLPDLQRDLADLDRNLKLLGFLQQRAAQSHNPELLGASKEFAALLPPSRAAVARARQVTDALPKLLGRDEFKRYLLLFENPAELRPTGGFTGTYGRLTLNDGRLTEFTIESIYNPGNQARVVTKLDAPRPLVRAGGPAWLMQDANWNPDFLESAKQYQWFYDKSGGPSTDGVIALTATPVVEILRVLGPIEQPDGREPITADTFLRDVASYQQSQASIAGSDPKALLRDFAPKLLEKIRRAPADQQQRVQQILATAITAKDIQFYFTDGALEQLVSRAGIAGRLLARPGELAVVDANLNGTKSSTDVSTLVNRRITVDEHGGQRVDLSVTRRHSGATSPYTNGTYTRIYVPKGAAVDTLDGWSDYEPPNVSSAGDFAVVGGWTDVAPGGERTVQVTYRPSEAVDLPAGEFPLSFWRQPGSNVQVTTEVTLPAGYVWDGQPDATVTGTVIRFDEPVSADLTHQLTFRKLP